MSWKEQNSSNKNEKTIPEIALYHLIKTFVAMPMAMLMDCHLLNFEMVLLYLLDSLLHDLIHLPDSESSLWPVVIQTPHG